MNLPGIGSIRGGITKQSYGRAVMQSCGLAVVWSTHPLILNKMLSEGLGLKAEGVRKVTGASRHHGFMASRHHGIAALQP